MKDIDFDELDRAVNSLMASSGNVPVEKDATPAQAEVQEDKTAQTVKVSGGQTSRVVETVERPEVNHFVDRSEVVQPRQAPVVPAARRGGRFMDMVQKPQQPVAVRSAAAPSRVGTSIEPRQAVDAATVSATPQVNTVPPSPQVQPGSENPQLAKPNEESTATISPEKMPRPFTDDTSSGLTISPAETPFLNDAKVEKRPLNSGVSPSVSLDIPNESQTPIEEEDVKDTDDDIDALSGDTLDPGTPEPYIAPELDKDLVAIESSSIEDSKTNVKAEEPITPLGPTSIARQYTPKESTRDQSHAAIYDSSQFSEPLTHPAKKANGWLWVLWIIVLLAIGAGAALLLYRFNIIP